MDSINVERIHGLKRYRQQEFMKTLMFYPIVILTCVIFCTSPFWFRSMYSSIKTFLCDSIPTILSFFFNAKSLFILGNLIVIFLLGESKIQASDSSSLPQQIEAENGKEKEKKKTAQVVTCKKENEVMTTVAMESKEKSRQVEEEKEIDDDDDKEEIEDFEEAKMEELIHELSTAELNRRADDFIARVNQQIRFEADHELLLCSY